MLITGLHTVCDVYCSDCGEPLGWKYLKAYEETQNYKVGKIVLQKFKITLTGRVLENIPSRNDYRL